MIPALNESSVLLCVKLNDAVKIHNRNKNIQFLCETATSACLSSSLSNSVPACTNQLLLGLQQMLVLSTQISGCPDK